MITVSRAVFLFLVRYRLKRFAAVRALFVIYGSGMLRRALPPPDIAAPVTKVPFTGGVRLRDDLAAPFAPDALIPRGRLLLPENHGFD